METELRAALETAVDQTKEYGQAHLPFPMSTSMFKDVAVLKKDIFEINSPLFNDVAQTSVIRLEAYQFPDAPSNRSEQRVFG